MNKPVQLARQARSEPLAIDEAMEHLVRLAPHLGSPPGIEPTLGIKRVFVKRFPFSIYFIELPTRFRVLAIAHSRRRPFYWGDRL